MKNAKHTVVGLLTIAMIGTMSVKQSIDLKASNRLAALLNKTEEVTTVINPEVIKISPEEAAEALSETYTEDELKQIEEKKSSHTNSYVLLTFGTLNVYEAPSDEGAVIDTLPQTTEVKILESTDGWYKISYGENKFGFVSKSHITESKAEADYAAMHYDNYKKAVVKTDGSKANIRRSASSNASIIGKLENGSELVLVYDENGYTKVFYGKDLDTGYVVSTAIEIVDAWMPKTEVASIQKAAADRRAAEAKARAEAATREKAAKAAKARVTKSASTYKTPAASSKGQAIVNTARKYMGVRYVWGGSSPKGFDCSGLVQYVCKSLGISVNRTAAAQFSNGRAVNKADLQPGDLVFFAKSKRISHVGIYIGNGQMIHAPHTGDVVRIASINSAYYSRTYVGARRVY